MIEVTKPFLPPYEEYSEYIRNIWSRNWLTNNGPLVNELELRLKEYLELDHLLYVTNGTIAIQLAIKALALKGEIITTPFSYVATTSSIVWENCKPVFVDIDQNSLNIDPAKIEESITKETSAILATHTYGNACDIEAIENIANKYSIKVIFDAAHCFGSQYKGKSLLQYGDISTTSFHATKIYHTIEGGAIITQNPDLLKKAAFMRNFGHNGPDQFIDLGINGKNSEVHAAMGLVNLNYISAILQQRKLLCDRYNFWLPSIHARKPIISDYCKINNSYYPLIFDSEEALLRILAILNSHKIYPRRYFFPSLAQLPYVEYKSVPVCEDVSRRVLCLPLYHTLSTEEIDLICRLILRTQNYS